MGIRKGIIGLCILSLFVVTGCGNGHSEVENPEKGENAVESIELLVDKNTAGSGEVIGISVLATMEDGEVLIVTKEVEIATSLTVDDERRLVVPEDALSGEDYAIEIEYKGIGASENIKVVNLLSETIDSEGLIIEPDVLDMVVNKERTLPAEYIPENLVTVRVPTCLENEEIKQMRKVAADALFNMFEEAKVEGLELVARSGYRSYNTQTALYNGYVSRHGQDYADKYSALPGQSEHQSGLAMDITAQSSGLQLEDYFGDTEEGMWVSDHAHEYGFIIRYPLGMEDITGYLYEPWHLRYLGVDLATEVYESGLTLEEYFMSFEE
jgi:D-alanyl-D-alanine carboxypeptidase